MSKYFAHFTGCLAGSASVCVCVSTGISLCSSTFGSKLLISSAFVLCPVPSLSLWFGCILPFSSFLSPVPFFCIILPFIVHYAGD